MPPVPLPSSSASAHSSLRKIYLTYPTLSLLDFSVWLVWASQQFEIAFNCANAMWQKLDGFNFTCAFRFTTRGFLLSKKLMSKNINLSNNSYQSCIQRYDICKDMGIYDINLLEYRHVGIHLKALDEENPNISTILSCVLICAFYGKPRFAIKPQK